MTDKAIPALPGPKGHFLLGNLLDFRRDLIGTVLQAHRRFGDVVRFRVGSKEFVIFSHPELAERVFINDREKFVKLYEKDPNLFLALIFGKGVFTASGREWKDQRQMMQPVFQRSQIIAMTPFMINAGRRLLQRWEQKAAAAKSIELMEEMSQLTMDVIATSMFSADVVDRSEELAKDIAVCVRFVGQSLFDPLQLPLWFPTPRNVEFKRALGRINKLVYELIDKHHQNIGSYGDLLDKLLQARYPETDAPMPAPLIRDQVAGIFGAGHETTSCALTWTWYLLNQHPDALSRLRAELDSVLQGRDPSVDDLPNLPYVRMVLEESMRLYPPVPHLPRILTCDIDANGYRVRAGSVVLVSFSNIHRHAEIWDDPDTFRPERFNPAANHARHRCAYLPFGVGPRVCLGSHFALIEAQLLLALMAQRFDVRVIPGQRVVTEVVVTLRPKHGLHATLKRRSVPASPPMGAEPKRDGISSV
ncbi:MAG: cytochrome P450 [Sulfuricaulis sp.]